MYDPRGRGMRLLAHPIIIVCMALVALLPYGLWGIIALGIVEIVVIWGTLPDVHWVWRQTQRWWSRELGGLW